MKINLFKKLFENHLAHALPKVFGRGTETPRGWVRLKTAAHRDEYRARAVYAKHRGPIPAGYDVHHINGKRNDDQIENLRLVRHERHPKVTYGKSKR